MELVLLVKKKSEGLTLNRLVNIFSIAAIMLWFPLYTLAAKSPLIGYWITNDGLSPKPLSIVQIFNSRRGLLGRIAKVNYYRPNVRERCSGCKGARRNKPLKGLIIMWGFQRRKKGWIYGKILNSNNGKVFDCRLKTEKSRHILIVRAFMGIPMLGRTLFWRRTTRAAVTRRFYKA